MRYLIGVFALALALGVSLSAQAKVQNVKVGGDVQIRSISRSNWDLNDMQQNQGDDTSWFDSTVRLQVSADLTNDVGAVVRLINERIGGYDNNSSLNQQNVQLDLGYITLDNMFGYPVKATLGRQEILFGEGFLIGDGYNGVITSSPIFAVYGDSIRKAFDALRLTYSAKPYTVDLFTAKIDEYLANVPQGHGDINLSGININYAYLDIATFDLGYFIKNDGTTTDSSGNYYTRASETKALSLGGEGSIPSVPGLAVKGEYVWEGGNVATGNATEQDLDARAWYTGAKYTLQDNPYQPYFGVTYLFMSGDKNAPGATTGDYNQFDPLYPDFEHFGTWAYLQGANNANLKAWKLTAGLKPTEALSLDLAYAILKVDETPQANMDNALGNELDAGLTYDYTEDVQFGLSAAWFNPGDYFNGPTNKPWKNEDSTATQIMGSVTVSF